MTDPADVAAVRAMAAARITQAEAARVLGWTLQRVNGIVRTRGIFWPVKRQGRQRTSYAAQARTVEPLP